MKIIQQTWQFEIPINAQAVYGLIERAGRTCYKSELSTTLEDQKKFIKKIIESKHESVLEHYNISVRIVTDRGVSHELVRHRLASYSQESTRYCNYSQNKFNNELTFIEPIGISEKGKTQWMRVMKTSEFIYLWLLEHYKEPPEIARSVLPNSLKTEIVMTTNIREWRHIFMLRTSKAAHPQMRDLMLSMLQGFSNVLPFFFEDLINA